MPDAREIEQREWKHEKHYYGRRGEAVERIRRCNSWAIWRAQCHSEFITAVEKHCEGRVTAAGGVGP